MNEGVKTLMLFNLLGQKLGTGFAYSVYSKDGIAPSITTMTGGGGRQPFIAEIGYDSQDTETEGIH